MRILTVLIFGSLILTAATASAAEICESAGPAQFTEIRYCASSVLPPQGRWSYGPLNMGRTRDTSWVEGKSGDGIGEYVIMRFDGPMELRTIWIENGYGRNRKTFAENNRIRTLRLTTSDGIDLNIALRDQFELQAVRFPRLARTSWVKLKILSVYRGTKYRDTAIGGLYPDFEELENHE